MRPKLRGMKMSTKSLKEIDLHLLSLLEKKTSNTEARVKQLQDASNGYRAAMSNLNRLLPKLVDGLTKLGLGIDSLSVTQTGLNNEVWDETTCLKVGMNAVPISGKFKFIKFNGYDSRGRGKNQSRLDEKASKIRESLTDSLGGGISFQVNQFSLECDKNENDMNNRVMIDFWVK
jgi:hypothetical protein